MIIVSNNSMVLEKYSDMAFRIDGTPLEVMEEVRRRLQAGYRLIGMPISGNLRLARSPYRSVVIDKDKEQPSAREHLLVEDACQRLADADITGIPDNTHDDYKYMDMMFVDDVFIELKH